MSRRFGELWLGFERRERVASTRRNATQLQVAAGALAGWQQFGRRRGIHFVEDLDCRRYIDTVGRVLGPPRVVYDADAASLSLRERVTDAVEALAAPVWLTTSVS